MSRVGTKRSDRRWKDGNGNIWASEFEYRVYEAMATTPGTDSVQRASEGKDHTFGYSTQVTKGSCLECGSGKVVQQRVYTPDLFCTPPPDISDGGRYYFETKGYFSAERRNLYRAFLQSWPELNIMLIFQNGRKPKGMKRTMGQYADSFFKIPWCIWDPGKGQEMPTRIFDFLGGLEKRK